MKEFFKFTLATITGIIVTSIIGFLFLMMVIGALIASTEKTVMVENQSMLVIKLDNQIVDRAPNDPFSDFNIPGFGSAKKVGLDQIISSIENAVDDDRIKCIYLDLSMVNGGMAAVEEIRNALIAFKDSTEKPIYAYGEMIDQKAYYLATVADKIVLNPQGVIDFRGLGGEVTFFKNALEKLGVEMQIVRHGKFKAAVEPLMLEKMSDENREQTMVYLNSMWNQMLKGISEKRNIPVEKLNQLADDVLTFRRGEKALEAGLVDALMYKDEVLDDLREITGIAPGKGIPVIGVSNYAKAPAKKGKKSTFSRDKIAVIYASGDIGMAMMGSEGIDGEKLSREIRKVRQDSSFKAIVLRIDSPGGSAYHSEVIWREIKLAADTKPVVVSMGNVAASGGYYIACAADKIVAQPNTITGSIGVFGTIPNASELMNKKLGITTDVVKTNKHSDMPSFTRKMTDFERDLMQENVENIYDVFLDRVADGRNMTKEAIDEIGQGRVWTGENALEIGLVDELGGLQRAIEIAAELSGLENFRTVDLPALTDPFQELLKSGSDNVRAQILKSTLGESAKYYELVERAGKMNGVYALLPYSIEIR
jgi:protease IV